MNLNEKQRHEMLEAAKPLIKWMNDNFHPHGVAMVDQGGVELTESICIETTNEFIQD